MIRLYGSPRTRVNRVMWLLEEMGIEYELRDAFEKPGDPPSEEIRRLNPNAKVPVLVSGDFVMWESLAINLHLVEHYGGDLAPKTEAGKAAVLQWTLWTATELEPRVLAVSRNRLPQIDREPDEALAQEAERELLPTLRVLDGALAGSGHLVEGRFTIADVNVGSVLATGLPSRVDFAPVANVEKWINACVRRPAARSVFARAMKSAGLA
jgi:glutathione S-transferase